MIKYIHIVPLNGSQFVPIFVFSLPISIPALSRLPSSFIRFYFVCGVEYKQSAVQHAEFTRARTHILSLFKHSFF